VLVFPAMLAGVLLGLFLSELVPTWLTPIAWVLTGALGFIPLVLVPKPVKAEQSDSLLGPFIADPNNDKVIIVRGWDEDELRIILEGFAAFNSAAAPTYLIELHLAEERCFRLTFPADIHPFTFAALVNYLHYPIEVEVSNHLIHVAGLATVDAAFEDLPEDLIGQRAILYVPENDQDYDVVYLQTESGANLIYSFQEPGWCSIKQARLADETRLLAGWCRETI